MREPKESKSGILELLKPVYKYYKKQERKADFFLDVMQFNVDAASELKLSKADKKMFREFFQKKMDSSALKLIFEQITLYMVLIVVIEAL